MYRKDYIEREFEKMGILLATILGLKKSGKEFTEIEQATKTGLRDVFGEAFDLENIEQELNLGKLTPQKQQALADILFELGITANQQSKLVAAKRFLSQYLFLLTLIDNNSTTFSFQNMANKAIAEEIIQL